ncbi:MAG: DUF2935 domain-containing protein [Desulfotomaculaceae bacterium]|nr:DUF2935 domain-containing protein [Desulfotomaculaceae bacterium]
MNGNLDSLTLFEHRFWLQILGDHARFIFHSLSPKEDQTIRIAQNFINIFDRLLAEARQPLNGIQLDTLTQQAYAQGKEFRSFKLELLRRHLVEQIIIHLTPTFINHMVNELEEYLQILACFINKQQTQLFDPVHLHLVWLLDAKGHAFFLASSLDEVEKQYIRRSTEFNIVFADLFDKSLEMKGYLRTGLNQFPALSALNMQAENTILHFSCFLQELQKLIQSKEILSILTPLATDHMLREECYYLLKLSLVSDVKKPNCDPMKPRIEN